MHESGEHRQPSRPRFGGMAGGLIIGMIVGVIVGFIQGDLMEGLSFGLLIGLALGAGLEGRGRLMQYRPAAIRRVLFAAGLFLVLLLGSSVIIDDIPGGGIKTLVALAPAAAFALFVLALVWAIAGLDELQRRIQTEAIAIGFALTAVATLAVGLLGQVGVQQPNWGYVGLPMVLGWGVGKLWILWKYR